MEEKTPVTFVWSATDEEKYTRYQRALRWFLAPIILLGLIIFMLTIWAFIEFGSCSWKLASPVVSLPVLICFLIVSVLAIVFGFYGLTILDNKDPEPFKTYIRIDLLFVVGSLILIIILWIYTLYNGDNKYKRENMELAYNCSKEVAECWDSMQKTHECCGWKSPKDWTKIPMSCCDPTQESEKDSCQNMSQIPLELVFQDGCRRHLFVESLAYFLIASISWIIIIILFIAVIIIAMHLLRGLKIKEKLRPLVY